MEIPGKVYTAHRRLSMCSAQYLDYAKNNPESRKRGNFNRLLNDKRFQYFRSQPWPTFINPKTKKKMAEASVKVFNLIKSIPCRLFDYDAGQISRCYRFSESESRFILMGVNDDTIQGILGRGDFIVSPSGQLKCIEFNAHGNIGGWELDQLEPLYLDTPVISGFLNRYRVKLHKNKLYSILLEHIQERAREYFNCDDNDEINLVVAVSNSGKPGKVRKEYPLEKIWNRIWRKTAANGSVFFCDLKELRVIENKVMFKNKRVHSLIELFKGRIPLLFMNALKEGELLIYNGPVALIMSNKLNLALLSKHQNSPGFSPEEKEIIKEYIPWTRKITAGETFYKNETVRLEDFIVSNREQLVIKPAVGYGGFNIHVGMEASPGEWKQLVDQALFEESWVVQEYVPSSSFLYQSGEESCTEHHAVWGLFVFGTRYAGGFVRLLPAKGNQGIINSHQGAEESIILEVEEE